MHDGTKIAIIGGVFAVATVGIGYGAYATFLDGGANDGGSDGARTTSQSAPGASGPPTADEIEKTAADFLAAWADGEAEKAAQLTDNAVAAQPLLAGYRNSAHVSEAVITPGKPTGAKVPFTVEATVSYDGRSKPWSYASELTVVRGVTTGRPLVDWQPTVIHPKLAEGSELTTSEAKAPPIEAVDHAGVELTKEKYPSLGPILDQLRKKYGEQAGGTAGVELAVTSSDPNSADQTLLTLTEGKAGTLRTTLDAGVQAAAEQAVKRYGGASVVAVKPSTGEIRAVANSKPDGFNTALQGGQAPGSTMKIVTAAMMMDRGLVNGPGSRVECPATVSWEGVVFHNLNDFEYPTTSFRNAFAQSCNSTFIKPIKPLGASAHTALGETARKYFGIGEVWNTGVATFDGDVPVSAGAETAASYIGQGKIRMNALNMASIAATAKSGWFKQPVIVAKSLDDRDIATAQPLPHSIAQSLRTMMKGTAVSGTGKAAMSGVSGNKGAKTGSAEVDGQGSSNSWFTAYAGDLAAAAVVQAGGHGGDAAGPVVASVLNAR
ncbi:penicillin-binding transpeptidase domain-containing protein [Streptomyces sp. MUM 178J]|uniref:penicillin-binding transpeptidase domain-containing protein n=1 Tax=Streptomyces sp. MUM 178J TaxID=2791991 RepID=UPI002E7B133B|nr:penicillin-binding transpeptidase domain-containing protein [Streptomyces sp. MUM 178J]WRQ82622.1 penicillin-binding transpeptidase domain-containing protein [Streptomyces sp. MUM 178J]